MEKEKMQCDLAEGKIGYMPRRSKKCWWILLCCIALRGWTVLPVSAAEENNIMDNIAQSIPEGLSTEENVVVVIDPGHGGANEGTIENGFLEKAMTLTTAEAMYEELSLFDGVTVYMTRTGDVDLTLKERAEFAAGVGADFLFSIHYNASPEHNLFGSEVWIPSQPPLNAYGYQFGCAQLNRMQEMGLYLRGVKTRLNDKGTDFYGIIRESAALSVPAVIIEHCHVDEERDYTFCDEEEELIAFGKADAHAAAEYFGLSSTALGIDYSEMEYSLPDADAGTAVAATLKDETPPDVCMIVPESVDYDKGQVALTVSAADYDSLLLYYDYSIDGGITYSALQPWPEVDVLTGAYKDTFLLTLDIPSGVLPNIRLRAYNLFDAFTESNTLSEFRVFHYGSDENAADGEAAGEDDAGGENGLDTGESDATGVQAVMPESQVMTQEAWTPEVIEAAKRKQDTEKEVSVLTFLEICLACMAALLITILLIQLSAGRRRKKNYRRKDDGNRQNHPR